MLKRFFFAQEHNFALIELVAFCSYYLINIKLRRLMLEFDLFVLVEPSFITYSPFPKDYGELCHHQKHSYWSLFSKYICNRLLQSNKIVKVSIIKSESIKLYLAKLKFCQQEEGRGTSRNSHLEF